MLNTKIILDLMLLSIGWLRSGWACLRYKWLRRRMILLYETISCRGLLLFYSKYINIIQSGRRKSSWWIDKITKNTIRCLSTRMGRTRSSSRIFFVIICSTVCVITTCTITMIPILLSWSLIECYSTWYTLFLTVILTALLAWRSYNIQSIIRINMLKRIGLLLLRLLQ